MLVKLVLVIMVVGATASALLVNRQQRIETFHEMSLIHHRLLEHEATLWKLRGQIAQRCRPAQVRQAVSAMGGQWTPIPARPVQHNQPVTALRIVNADGKDITAAPEAPAKPGKRAQASKKKLPPPSGQTQRTAMASPRTARSRNHLDG